MIMLAVLILVAAGIYVCTKAEVQVSPKFVIRGRAALSIGLALIAGGLLAVLLPMLCGFLGLLKDFVASLVLTLAVMAAALGYIGLVVVAEKRRISADGPPVLPTADSKAAKSPSNSPESKPPPNVIRF